MGGRRAGGRRSGGCASPGHPAWRAAPPLVASSRRPGCPSARPAGLRGPPRERRASRASRRLQIAGNTVLSNGAGTVRELTRCAMDARARREGGREVLAGDLGASGVRQVATVCFGGGRARLAPGTPASWPGAWCVRQASVIVCCAIFTGNKASAGIASGAPADSQPKTDHAAVRHRAPRRVRRRLGVAVEHTARQQVSAGTGRGQAAGTSEPPHPPTQLHWGGQLPGSVLQDC